MIVVLLGMSILAALAAAGVTLALGHGILMALAAYMLAGSATLLLLAGLVAFTRHPAADGAALESARTS